MIKTYLIVVYILAFYLIASLNGCSTVTDISEIKAIEFKGVSQINKGESATLNWNIANADKVRIIEKQRNFDAIDSIKVTPDTTSSYNFIITKGKDSLKLVWKVYVNHVVNGIETGPVIENIKQVKPSYINSKILSGIQSSVKSAEVRYLKVMRHFYPFDNNNTLRTKALVLDEFGNYLNGFSGNTSGFININAAITCDTNFVELPVSGFVELKEVENQAVDFALLVDNSAIAGEYFPIYNQISSFVSAANKYDRFALYKFNQNFNEIIPLKLVNDISPDDIIASKPSGLSSIYKSLKYAIEKLSKENVDRTKAVILISYSYDNASIIYDRNDIIDLAISKNIPVYVIGVGNAVDSYSLSTLAHLSGARYYSVDESELENVSLILNEILFSQKSSYQFDVTIPAESSANCKSIKVNYEFITSASNANDTLIIPLTKERHEFNYMAVASFDVRDTVVLSEFDELLDLLTDVMKKNPAQSIELIGNSSIEGNNQYSYNLGLKRAQAVRKILINNGVNPSKIRIRSDGSNNPLYYLQELTWMQYYNRRVELRWLDPSLLPYEIIAQISDTETEALSFVENWEDKGLRSYYERYLINNIPVYRVKIWGYSTLAEAEKSAKKLSSDYGLKFVVQ
jgi:outer membrane protein OmpA-like peptidoglycan-associated protein